LITIDKNSAYAETNLSRFVPLTFFGLSEKKKELI